MCLYKHGVPFSRSSSLCLLFIRCLTWMGNFLISIINSKQSNRMLCNFIWKKPPSTPAHTAHVQYVRKTINALITSKIVIIDSLECIASMREKNGCFSFGWTHVCMLYVCVCNRTISVFCRICSVQLFEQMCEMEKKEEPNQYKLGQCCMETMNRRKKIVIISYRFIQDSCSHICRLEQIERTNKNHLHTVHTTYIPTQFINYGRIWWRWGMKKTIEICVKWKLNGFLESLCLVSFSIETRCLYPWHLIKSCLDTKMIHVFLIFQLTNSYSLLFSSHVFLVVYAPSNPDNGIYCESSITPNHTTCIRWLSAYYLLWSAAWISTEEMNKPPLLFWTISFSYWYFSYQ